MHETKPITVSAQQNSYRYAYHLFNCPTHAPKDHLHCPHCLLYAMQLRPLVHREQIESKRSMAKVFELRK